MIENLALGPIGQSGMLGTVDVETNGEVAVLRMYSGSRNPLSTSLRSGLINAFRQIKRLSGMKAVVLTGKGAYFASGYPLEELEQPPNSPSLADVTRVIEEFELPVVAALQGPAHDGGMELALAAHYRVATKTASVGFEAIHQGLIPSAGGTQRLARMIGAQNSLKVLLGGRRLKVGALGLVFDAVIGESFDAQAVAFAESLIRAGKGPRRTRDMDQGLQDPQAFQAAVTSARDVAKDQGEAAQAIIRCVEAAALLPFDAGMALEQDAYEAVLHSDMAQSFRHLLAAEAQARSQVAQMDDGAFDVHRLAILGTGRTAVGLASVCLCASIGVLMIAPGEDMVTARASVQAHVERILKRKRSGVTSDQVMQAYELAPNIEECVNSDMVIDLAGGAPDDQLERFRHLGEFMPGHSVLVTGTAQGGLEDLGRSAQRARQVVGLYAYAPVDVLPLVEVAATPQTSQVVIASMSRFVSRLEKFCVLASDAPGLIGNSVQNALFKAAERLLYMGVDFEEIDEALRDNGFALGPFRLWDLGRGPRVGRLAEAMSEQGFTGRTTGAGFYLYDEGDTRRRANPNAARIVEALRAGHIDEDALQDYSDIQFFCVSAMANEGARLLQKGIAKTAGDIDLVMTQGHGFPRHWGGPMNAVNRLGLLNVRNRLASLSVQDDFWLPSSLFDELIKNGQKFGVVENL